jgi:dUTP pyrophosphatase
MEIPPGYEAQVRPRSGMAAKYGVTVLNSPGTIDSDYRGEIKVILQNHGLRNAYDIKPGDKIAQLVIQKLPTVEFELVSDFLSETARGAGGFGHTGQ